MKSPEPTLYGFPRERFTKCLRKMLARLDERSEIVGTFPSKKFPFLQPITGGIRVDAIWAYGSYARGAPRCADLDLIIQTTAWPCEGSLRSPELQHVRRDLFGHYAHVQFSTGTPEQTSAGLVDIQGAILIWTPSMDWSAALEGIALDPTAGHMPRKSDGIPFSPDRLGVYPRQAEALINKRAAGLLDWSLLPFDSLAPESTGLNTDEQTFLHFAGSKATKRTALAALATTHSAAFQAALAKAVQGHHHSFSNTHLRNLTQRDNKTVHFAFGHWFDTDIFEDPSVLMIVASAHIKKHLPNGLWIITRGANWSWHRKSKK